MVAAGGGRTTLVWNGVLDILKAKLPGVVTLANEKNGLTLPQPSGYYVAGEKLGDKFPHIIVGASTGTNTLAPTTQYKEISLVVYANFGVQITRHQIDDSMDYAHLIEGCLLPYQKGYWDDSSMRVWSALTPTGLMPGPGDWTNYKGFAAHFTIFVPPSPGHWKFT